MTRALGWTERAGEAGAATGVRVPLAAAPVRPGTRVLLPLRAGASRRPLGVSHGGSGRLAWRVRAPRMAGPGAVELIPDPTRDAGFVFGLPRWRWQSQLPPERAGSGGDSARPGPGPGDRGAGALPRGHWLDAPWGVCKDRLPSGGGSRGDGRGWPRERFGPREQAGRGTGRGARPLGRAGKGRSDQHGGRAGRSRRRGGWAPAAPRLRPGGLVSPRVCPLGGEGACAPRTRRVRVPCACTGLGCVSSRSASGPLAPRLLPLQAAPFRDRVTATHDPRNPGCAPRHTPAGARTPGLDTLREVGDTALPGPGGKGGGRRPGTNQSQCQRVTRARPGKACSPLTSGGLSALPGRARGSQAGPRRAVPAPLWREALSTWRGQLPGEPLAK